MDTNQAKQLLERYGNGRCNTQEKELVEQWWNQLIETGEWQWGEGEKKKLQQLMEARLLQQINDTSNARVISRVHRIHFLRRSKWWAAAAVIILFATGSYFMFFNNKSSKQDEIVKTEVGKDLKAPSTNRAMITLANGKRVYLDSVANGSLAMQGGVNVVKLADGKIIYEGTSASLNIEYNTLSNPRGSKAIDMILADGSQVWLNAGSSVTFPVAFIGNERKVEITGEAFFDVTHNVAMPFKLKKGNMEVTVLGTKFNVNAYEDEVDIKVTLLEGSVKVSNGTVVGILKPGQQAKITSDLKILSGVDLEEVMAWKNGLFLFNMASLQEVMRQISRWYDVEIVYEGKIAPQQFGGKMQRDLNLSEVLDGLAKSQVRFRIEGKKLIVMP